MVFILHGQLVQQPSGSAPVGAAVNHLWWHTFRYDLRHCCNLCTSLFFFVLPLMGPPFALFPFPFLLYVLSSWRTAFVMGDIVLTMGPPGTIRDPPAFSRCTCHHVKCRWDVPLFGKGTQSSPSSLSDCPSFLFLPISVLNTCTICDPCCCHCVYSCLFACALACSSFVPYLSRAGVCFHPNAPHVFPWICHVHLLHRLHHIWVSWFPMSTDCPLSWILFCVAGCHWSPDYSPSLHANPV